VSTKKLGDNSIIKFLSGRLANELWRLLLKSARRELLHGSRASTKHFIVTSVQWHD